MTTEPPVLPEEPAPPPRAGDLRSVLHRYRVPIVALAALMALRGLSEWLGPEKAWMLLGLAGLVWLALAVSIRALRVVTSGSWRFRFGMRHLMLLIVVLAIGMQLARALGMALPLLIALSVPPLVLALVYVFLVSRRLPEQEGLVSVLAMAAERGLPLGPAATAYAGLCSRRYGRRVRDLAARLDAGTGLPEALDALSSPGPSEPREPGRREPLLASLVPRRSDRGPVLPPAAAALARVGWQTGRLGPALRQAEAMLAARRDAPSPRALLGYPLAVLGGVLFGWSFMAYFIVPKFRAILLDFGVSPAGPWQLVWQAPSALANATWLGGGGFNPWLNDGTWGWAWPLLLGAVQVAGLVWIGLAAGWLGLRLLRWLGPGLGPLVGGTGVPGWLAPLDLRRDGATVLRALGLGVEAGRPLPEVLRALPSRELGRLSQKRLAQVRADVAAGRPWVASLNARGLVRPVDAAVLDAAERAGNLGWALSDRADAIDRRENLRLRAWGQILQPLAILGLGVLVLSFALGYFLPLVTMIEAMAEDFGS